MKTYVADYETIVDPNKTRVWAWGTCEVGNHENFEYGTDMDNFIRWCKQGGNKLVYFHNLKFDGEFIIHWLLTHGYEYDDDKNDMTFNTIISDMGQFYVIEIIFKKLNKGYKKVTFHDSLKKLPFPVEKIAKAFDLPIKKLDIDYKAYRPENHILTQEEIDYLRNDVQIVAQALDKQLSEGLDRMTNGSDALNSFKKMIGKKQFERLFPILPQEIDKQIRYAYRGGFTYLNDRYASKDIGFGQVYDVTSLYPSVMYYDKLPYGQPLYFTGKYEDDDIYPLYIQKLTCEFELKKDHIPTVQIKNGGRFLQTEYLKSNIDKLGNMDPVTLVMTNVDLELFFKHYDVYVHEWHDGWKFKQCTGVFNGYIDHWIKIKEKASEDGNEGLRTLAKLMLNSLYGKFATNPNVTGKKPILEDDNTVRYILKEEEFRDPIYTAMGVFITSWARFKTISTAQGVYDRFIYADTDSIHIWGEETPTTVDIDPVRMGAWKHEGNFTRARFVRQKTYIEEMDGKLHVTCAGMPDNLKKMVTWDNFHRGLVLDGKLLPKHIDGGVYLEDTQFTLK